MPTRLKGQKKNLMKPAYRVVSSDGGEGGGGDDGDDGGDGGPEFGSVDEDFEVTKGEVKDAARDEFSIEPLVELKIECNEDMDSNRKGIFPLL